MIFTVNLSIVEATSQIMINTRKYSKTDHYAGESKHQCAGEEMWTCAGANIRVLSDIFFLEICTQSRFEISSMCLSKFYFILSISKFLELRNVLDDLKNVVAGNSASSVRKYFSCNMPSFLRICNIFNQFFLRPFSNV